MIRRRTRMSQRTRRNVSRGASVTLLTLGVACGALTACHPAGPWQEIETVEAAPSIGPTPLQETSPVPEALRIEPEPPEDEPPTLEPDEEGRLALSVEQAVFLAMRNNRELSVRQLEPVIVGTFADLERAVFDPTLFGEGGYSRERREQVVAQPGVPPFDIRSERGFFEGGLRQRLSTGTDLEGALSQERTSTNISPSQHQVRAGVTLTQALLQGRRREANLARIDQARLDERISEYELRGFTESLAARVEGTYWRYALARRQVEIFEHALEVARQQLQETEDRVEVGVLPRTELAAARAEVARRNQDLIDARNRAQQLRIDLLRLLNPESQAQWDQALLIADELDVADVPLDELADHVELGQRQRPELNEARLRLERGRLEVIRTRDGLLPRLDLFATFGKSGFADAFGDAVRDIDGSAYDFTAGLRVEYPLGNRAARAEHRAATATRHQAALSIQNLAQLVEADVRQAYLEVQRTHDQIDATAATRELQEEVLRSEMEKFEAGTSTALLVAQAQRDLLTAELGEVEAMVEYREALIELYRLEGSLLLRRGIDAPGESPVNN